MTSLAASIVAPIGSLLDQRLTVLKGPAGTGKTTLLFLVAARSGKTLFLTPTHSLKRSSEKDFKNVRTVAWAALAGKREFSGYRTVLITEAAMMRDLEISSILGKLPAGTHVLLDCDPYQIPAITEPGTKTILGSASFMQLVEKPTTRCVLMKQQYRTANRMAKRVIDAIQGQDRSALLEGLLDLISSSLVDPATLPYNDEDIVVAHTHTIRDYVWREYCAANELEMVAGTNLVLGHQVRLCVTKKRVINKRKKMVVYANGDLCTLLQVAPQYVRVKLKDQTEHKVPNLQNGKPAVSQTGCFTAYSVQGITADGHVYVVCDTPSTPPPICISTLYVMLTRARTKNVSGPPENLHFVVHNWARFAQAISRKVNSGPFSAFQQNLCTLLSRIPVIPS